MTEYATEDRGPNFGYGNDVVNFLSPKIDKFDLVGKCVNHSFRLYRLILAILHKSIASKTRLVKSALFPHTWSARERVDQIIEIDWCTVVLFIVVISFFIAVKNGADETSRCTDAAVSVNNLQPFIGFRSFATNQCRSISQHGDPAADQIVRGPSGGCRSDLISMPHS